MSQAPKPCLGRFAGRNRMTRAACSARILNGTHRPTSAWSAYHSLAAWFETREYCILENGFGGWEPGVLAWAFNLQ